MSHDDQWDKQRTLVLLALANGLSRAAAAARAGISDRTLRRWFNDEPEFAEAVEIAMGHGRAMYEELLLKAGKKDWRAALAAYEVVYLGGERVGKGSPVNVLVQNVQSPARISPTAEQSATRSLEVLRILKDAMKGDEQRVAELLARNEQRASSS